MDFIRTIVSGVRDVRSRARMTGTGRMENSGPPVITVIEHKPGYWPAYGLQTAVCALLVASGISGLVYVAAVRPPGPFRVSDLMFAPFGLMILIGVVIPVYLVRSFHQLQRVFDASDEHLEPSGDARGESADAQAEPGYVTDAQVTQAALGKEHPNVGFHTDPTWIMLVATLLFATAALQLFSGSYLSFRYTGGPYFEELVFDLRRPLWFAFGLGQLAQVGLNTVLGVLVIRHHAWSLALALVVAVANLGLAILTQSPFWISLAAASVFLLLLATRGFRRMNQRIAAPEKGDALEAYYHNLMLALVHVMRADGRCDRAELRKITRLCNNMNLSAYEQYVVQAAANAAAPEPVPDVVTRYLDAARLLRLAEPELSMLLCAYAVAGADGQLVPAEALALAELTDALEVKPAKLLSGLTELESPGGLTVEHARALLDVDDAASRADLDAGYLRLSEMLGALSFDHLGRPVAEIAKGHRAALVRAYELLKRQGD